MSRVHDRCHQVDGARGPLVSYLVRSVPLRLTGRVCTRAERDRAVGEWLLSAAQDVRRSRVDWDRCGVTLLRCGGIFTAVRIPHPIVAAAARTDDPGEINAYLHQALQGGPAFRSDTGHHYALVPPSTAHGWKTPSSRCLNAGELLAVPRPDRMLGDAASYWEVRMDSAGLLCTPGAVSQMIMTGRLFHAGREASCA